MFAVDNDDVDDDYDDDVVFNEQTNTNERSIRIRRRTKTFYIN